MRLGTLKYNERTEEGEVQIDWVLMPHDVVGLDVLHDWVHALLAIYEQKVEEVFKEK